MNVKIKKIYFLSIYKRRIITIVIIKDIEKNYSNKQKTVTSIKVVRNKQKCNITQKNKFIFVCSAI